MFKALAEDFSEPDATQQQKALEDQNDEFLQCEIEKYIEIQADQYRHMMGKYSMTGALEAVKIPCTYNRNLNFFGKNW